MRDLRQTKFYRGKEKKEVKYKCIYCDYVFTQYVGTTGGGTDQRGNRISKASSQVSCPRCGNFLKTWG